MRKNITRSFISNCTILLLLASLLLSSCTGNVSNVPNKTVTQSPVPTSTQPPTPTVPVTATAILSPTPTATLSYPVTIGTSMPPASTMISPENIGQMNQLAVLKVAPSAPGTVNNIALTTDGKMVALGTYTGVYIYYTQSNINSLKPFITIKTPSPVFGLAFSPVDPDLLATYEFTGSAGQVHMWTLSSGEMLLTIPSDYGIHNRRWDFFFSPKGNYLISVVGFSDNIEDGRNTDMKTMIWRVKDGQVAAELPTWERIAIATDDTYYVKPTSNKIQLISLADGSLIKEFTGYDCKNIRLSPDGMILAASCNNLIRFMHTNDGAFITAIEGDVVSFSPDNKTIVSGVYPVGNDFYRKIWRWTSDGSAFELISTVKSNGFSDPAFSPLGTYVVFPSNQIVGNYTRWTAQTPVEINIYNVADGSLLTTTHPMTGGDCNNQWCPFIEGVSFLSNEETFATWWLTGDSSSKAVFRMWSARDGQSQGSLEVPIAPSEAVAFSPDGSILASSSSAAINLWSTSDWSLHSTFQLPPELAGYGIEQILFSPDGKMLAVKDQDGHIYSIWDVGSGEMLDPILYGVDRLHADYPMISITDAGISSDGKLSGSMNFPFGVIQVKRVLDKSLVCETKPLNLASPRITFSLDDQLFMAESWVFHVRDCSRIPHINLGYLSNYAFAFSPDSRIIAITGFSAWAGYIILLVNTAKPELLFSFYQFNISGRHIGLAFSPDGTLFAVNIPDGVHIFGIKP